MANPVTTIEVDVSVSKLKWRKKHFYYEGKFLYTQTSPAPGPGTLYVTPNGNMLFVTIPNKVEVILNWKTPQVDIDGTNYAATLLQPNTNSIRLAEGIGNKPIVSPPGSGSEISVPAGTNGTSLKIVDENDDGKPYTFNLIVHIDKDGGQYLIDDPIIENQGGPGGPGFPPPPPPPPPPNS